jgi:hypothetical protein
VGDEGALHGEAGQHRAEENEPHVAATGTKDVGPATLESGAERDDTEDSCEEAEQHGALADDGVHSEV